MDSRVLGLNLQSQALVPASLSWFVEEGYIAARTDAGEADHLIFGLWGPGDLVTLPTLPLESVRLTCLCEVVVKECWPSAEDKAAGLIAMLQQTTSLLRIHHFRSAEERLMAVLIFLGRRFGVVNSRGCRLSLTEMKISHRILAEISGLTRVTVTRTLSRFRTIGCLEAIGETDLWIPSATVARILS